MQKVALIDSALIKLNIDSTEKEEILTKMAKKLISEGYAKEGYLQAVINREKEYPTGLPTNGVGVAIPHADIKHVIKPGIAVASLKNSVRFNAMGNPDEQVYVKLIFMLAIKNPSLQISILKKLVSIFQNEQLLIKLTNIKNEDEFADVLDLLINTDTDR